MATRRNLPELRRWVAKWDRGEEVDIVTFGGLGDNYEWAIQSAIMAVVREGLSDREIEGLSDREILKKTGKVKDYQEIMPELYAWAEGVIADADKPDGDYPGFGGLSGAQSFMARNAGCFLLVEGLRFYRNTYKDKKRWRKFSKSMGRPWASPEEALQAGIEAGERMGYAKTATDNA